jgi:signal peptidase I
MLIPIVVIIGLVLGFFFGLQLALNNPVPLRVVESGSMSLPLNYITGPPRPYTFGDFLATLEHPFDYTLNTGDIIIIQGVDPETLNTDYPNSDIIVYQKPTDPTGTPIVHRIVSSYTENGTLYFHTKGDGNSTPYPAPVDEAEYDSHQIWRTGQGVPADLVMGKVVMRIPYFGWITLFLKGNAWGIPLIVGVVLAVIALELIVPVVKSKRESAAQAPVESEFML